MLEKRDTIIKNTKEKFLDYLRSREEILKNMITQFTTGELERTGLFFGNDQSLSPVANTLNWSDTHELLTYESAYVEKLAHSISDILQYNNEIRLPIHELNYVRRIIPTLELMLLNESNMESEMITDDFDHLSLYLLGSPLKGMEVLDILMDFVSLNIDKGLLEQPSRVVILDSSIAQKKGLSLEKVSELSEGGALNSLLNTSDTELSNEDIKVKQILLEVSKESNSGQKLHQFLTYHQDLRDSYLNKTDSYQKEDIDKIISSLDGLGVCLELCDKIRATLNRELSRRLKKTSINSYVVKKEQSNRKSKYILDTEYKQIKKEIGQYWDIYKMEAKRDLTEEERLYCAHLLLKIGTDSGLVRTFFYRTEEKTDLENPIGFYNRTYDKLKFYEQKCNFQQPLDNIQDYLQEIFITSSEDYQFWKDEIKKELGTMVQKLPQSYEYEVQKASSYCKKK